MIGSSGAISGCNTEFYADPLLAEHFVSRWLLLPISAGRESDVSWASSTEYSSLARPS
jgi:hypothetical protein